MTLKVAYDDNSESLINKLKEFLIDYPLIELEAYHENLFKERKKAFAIKSEWGTRKSPFAILIDDENKPVIAFYSERNECTIDNMSEILKSYIVYGNTSN